MLKYFGEIVEINESALEPELFFQTILAFCNKLQTAFDEFAIKPWMHIFMIKLINFFYQI